jgi:hypothetical protein
MNNLIQLIIILLGLLLIQQLFNDTSKKRSNLSKIPKPFSQKNEEVNEVEDNTTKAIDLLPVPAVILASQNPNVIESNEVKTL